MMIPSGMGEELQRQREMCIDPYTRVANRSKELVPMEVKTVLTLENREKACTLQRQSAIRQRITESAL